MVNRVLIRIKVVQMLYSYLLTRSEFKINDAPESASRDKAYAYAVYIDLLLLLIELSGLSAVSGKHPSLGNPNHKLVNNRVAKALSSDDAIRSAILRGNNHLEYILPIISRISAKISASEVYADYSKKRTTELADDVEFWITVFETIIGRDEELKEALRQAGDFTNAGFDLGVADVVDTLHSYVDTKQFYAKAKADLTKSLDNAYELYLSIFRLIMDITRAQEVRIENAKSKLLATSDDRNPNTKLANNLLVDYLMRNQSLKDLIKEYKIQPAEEASPLVKILLDKILASDIYKKYSEDPRQTLEGDAEFWREVLKSIIFVNDDFLEELEDKSIFWNDDLQTMGTFVLKTLRRIATSGGKEIEMLPKYKDDEDARFGAELFKEVVLNQEQYRHYIDMFVKKSQWDFERLAYMDIVIMTTAIAEIINYPAIPAAVSVNEYVEIANNYSTERSGSFINAILYAVLAYLNEKGIINK